MEAVGFLTHHCGPADSRVAKKTVPAFTDINVAGRNITPNRLMDIVLPEPYDRRFGVARLRPGV